MSATWGIRHREQAEMTWRARGYLTIAGARHFLTGLAAVLMHELFPQVDLGLSIFAWGILFLVGGTHLWFAAATGSENHARIGLALSAVVTSVWAAGFLAAWAGGVVASPLGGILFATLTFKDLTIVRDPMRSPFEPIIREYVDRSDET